MTTASAKPMTIPTLTMWRRLIERGLRIPLLVKLAGANALIVVVAWTVVYLEQRERSDHWSLLAVLAAALVAGMAVNMTLIVIALRPIKALEATAARVWKGDLGARVPWSAIADPGIEKLSIALNLLLETLSLDRRRARELTEHVVRQGDVQRAEVARQLHESIAQSLAGQLYLLTAAQDECSNTAVARDLNAAREIAQRCIEELRQLSGRVHPRLLDEFGLVAAVRHLARTVEAESGVTVDVRHGSIERLQEMSAACKATLYRVIEEAVRNAVRYSGATRIDVQISCDNGKASVEVKDNGVGFDTSITRVAAPGTGLGLIHEHLLFLGGEFGLQSTPGSGTSLSACLPLPEGGAIIEHDTGKAGASQGTND